MEEKCIAYFNKWKIMAIAKRVTAISAVAELYYQGYGTKKNLIQSIRYFRKASRYQFAYAQYRTGIFYLMEDDFIDNQEGIKYLKKAARNGHTESAFLLGVIFGTGELGIKDVGESDKWLEKALIGKHSVAQKYAGYLNKSGQIDRNYYSRVNDFIIELDVISHGTEKDQGKTAQSQVDIQWPSDSQREVITISSPTLGDVFDYELANLKTAPPASNLATGTRIQGRKCEKIFSCYKVDKEDFWRYVNTQSGSIAQ
ncbi:tetratricopeptide repeat protein [Colwellia sp. 12G3]|uniref:tetratricopeptide repeat protein n=1 Tax=Colwellia sp. 12G3 TaxID=2058299 RepID=UPI0018E34AC9|nr:tetratricopeptide repeat protein [Colwellia sp. 12G3]